MSQIKLTGVHLTDFKKHEELHVEFGDELTVIKGPNYAGKSSVFQAVYFALFGTKAVPGGKAVIPRSGKKNCKVTLQFMLGARHYFIERTLTSASLVEEVQNDSGNWESLTIATGASTVTEWAEAELGQPAAQYLLLTYSKQGTAAGLLDYGAPALNRVIEGLANADYVERLIVASGQRVQKANALLEAIGAAEDVVALRQQQVLADRDQASTGMQVGAARSQEDKLAAKFTEVENHYHQAVSLNFRLDSAANTVAFVQGYILSIQESISNLAFKPESLLDLDALRQKCQEADSYYSGLIGYRLSYTAAQKEIKALLVAKDKCDFTKSDAETKDAFEAAKSRADAAFNAQVELEEQNSDIEREIAKVQKDLRSSVCSACKRALDQSHLDKLTADLKPLENKQALMLPKLNKARALTETTEAQVNAIKRPPADWELRFVEASRELEIAEQEFEGAEEVTDEEMTKAKAASTDANNEFASAKHHNCYHASQRLELTNFETELATQMALLEKKQAVLKEGELVDLKVLEAEKSEQKRLWQEKSQERQQLDQMLALANSTFVAASSALTAAERVVSRRAEAEKDADRFLRLQRWLRDSKSAFLSQIWEQVLSITGAFARSATFGAVEEVLRSVDGDFSYREGGVEMPIEAASGGQRSIIGIGLRLALASLLPAGAGLLVLDEPSAELNDEHAAVLAGTLKAQGIQIILITHREGEEFAADKTIVLS